MFIPQNNPFNIFFDGWDEDKGDIPDIMKSKAGLLWRALRSCRKSVWERPLKSDASQGGKNIFCFYHLVEKICSFPTRVWQIFGYSNIFEYFPIRIFVRIIFVAFFWYKYIRTFARIVFWYKYIWIFVRIIFLIQIYN